MNATLRDVCTAYRSLWRARAHHRPEERALELAWSRTFGLFCHAATEGQHAQARRFARRLIP